MILSPLEYKIRNSEKEERFWKWMAEFYDREEKFELNHPEIQTRTQSEIFDSQWTCHICQLTISRPNAKQLDYAIYGHVQTFHDPSGMNDKKSKTRILRVSITESDHITGAWVLKLDGVVVQLFLGADGNIRAQKRMKDFL